TIRELRAAVQAAQERLARTAQLVEKGMGPQSQLLDDRAKMESAQAALARAETELKLLTGGASKGMGGDVGDPNAATAEKGIEWLLRVQDDASTRNTVYQALLAMSQEKHAVKGPVPDRIRAAFDKPVTLGAKGEKVSLDKALEIFKKEAGLDVPVRGPGDLAKMPVIVSQGEELPVGAWLQLYQDYGSGGSSVFYVRDYGVLFPDKSAAPPDAPTITEFWKQKPRETKKDEPKR